MELKADTYEFLIDALERKLKKKKTKIKKLKEYLQEEHNQKVAILKERNELRNMLKQSEKKIVPSEESKYGNI